MLFRSIAVPQVKLDGPRPHLDGCRRGLYATGERLGALRTVPHGEKKGPTVLRVRILAMTPHVKRVRAGMYTRQSLQSLVARSRRWGWRLRKYVLVGPPCP